MRKLIAYISISCIFILSSSFTALPTIREQSPTVFIPVVSDKGKEIAEKASLLYDRLNLRELGLSLDAFNYAYRGYEYLLDKNQVNDSSYLTICDFTQSAKQKRFYLIDIKDDKVLLNTYVAHGHNSGGEYATRFSNRLRSKQSSLGFYITGNTYVGEHGLSLRMEGMEPGFNDKAYRRAIVLHGASYIGNGSAGRSYGCPAVPKNESKRIINTIKNGTCLFIYHPDKKYIQGSKILND